MKFHILIVSIISIGFSFGLNDVSFATVLHKGDKVFIQDRTGVQWDVTQARSIGFKPEKFQYGIGKYAFSPLDDRHLKDTIPSYRNPRVIGISEGDESQAYAVPKLRHHEIANTHLADKPVTVGY